MNVMCRNVVHRHEPPVTSTPVKILLHDVEREFIVIDKPGSIVRPFSCCTHTLLIVSLPAGPCLWKILPQHTCWDSRE